METGPYYILSILEGISKLTFSIFNYAKVLMPIFVTRCISTISFCFKYVVNVVFLQYYLAKYIYIFF